MRLTSQIWVQQCSNGIPCRNGVFWDGLDFSPALYTCKGHLDFPCMLLPHCWQMTALFGSLNEKSFPSTSLLQRGQTCWWGYCTVLESEMQSWFSLRIHHGRLLGRDFWSLPNFGVTVITKQAWSLVKPCCYSFMHADSTDELQATAWFLREATWLLHPGHGNNHAVCKGTVSQPLHALVHPMDERADCSVWRLLCSLPLRFLYNMIESAHARPKTMSDCRFVLQLLWCNAKPGDRCIFLCFSVPASEGMNLVWVLRQPVPSLAARTASRPFVECPLSFRFAFA